MIKNKAINWLEQIFNAIKELAQVQATANQANWNEADSTSAAYIQNKPTIAQPDWNQSTATAADYIKNKPTVPAVTVIAGAVAESAFTPTSAAFADALAAIATNHGIVYLSYSESDETVYDMVVKVSPDKIVTAGSVEWDKPTE